MQQSALSLIPRPSRAARTPLPCEPEAVRAALKTATLSRHFAKAYRCTMLLNYLVERALVCPDASSPPEQEVGIAVFGRDPASYFPADDPIVRVQAGRLRLRLAAYYADDGALEPLRISVPLGRYQACITLPEAAPAVAAGEAAAPLLAFRPLVYLGTEEPGAAFTAGLSDELEFRLYRALSGFGLFKPAHAGAIQHGGKVLGGSLRQDASRLRVSLQLRDGACAALLWCAQFDSAGDPSIAAQELLAERCVRALQTHLL